MTACVELYTKWKKEPNFCGLGNQESNYIRHYIEFVAEFSKEFDISEDIVYKNAPRSALKRLLQFDNKSEVRKKVTLVIADTLRQKKSVTGKFVNAAIGIKCPPGPFVEDPKVIVAPMSDEHREVVANNCVKDKIRLITNVLTTGQMSILLEIMEIEDLDNEYAALSRIIIWAKERVDGKN